MLLTTVTQKGQITLPKAIRDELGLKVYSRVYVMKKGDHIEVHPTFDIVDIAGTFKPRRKVVSAVKLRGYMEKHYERV